MSPPPLRAVFLDLDDTLLDTAGILLEPARLEAGAAMVAKGLSGTAEEAARDLARLARERPGEEPFALLAEERGVDPVRVGLAGWGAFHRRAVPESLPLLDGVRETLGELRRRGVRLLLVTFGDPPTQEAKIRATGAGELVDRVVYEPLGPRADKGRAFRELLAAEGLEGAACLAVGDRPDGEIAAGRRNGMRTVRIRRGEHEALDPRGPEEDADHTVATFREAAAILLA